MNDLTVSKQWADRPADQRFLTLDELAAHVNKWDSESREVRAHVKDISCVLNDDGDDLRVIIPALERPAELTHWSMGGLSQRIGAPAPYLRSLPVELAAECTITALRPPRMMRLCRTSEKTAQQHYARPRLRATGGYTTGI